MAALLATSATPTDTSPGADPSSDDHARLLAAALACARRRVVVKRPARAEPLPSARAPDLAVPGGHTVRFDIYFTGAADTPG